MVAPSHGGNFAPPTMLWTQSPVGVPAYEPVTLADLTSPDGATVSLTATEPDTPYFAWQPCALPLSADIALRMSPASRPFLSSLGASFFLFASGSTPAPRKRSSSDCSCLSAGPSFLVVSV